MVFIEAKAHFGMWAITSAPLILGLDLREPRAVDFAWPIITNREILAVHAAWPAGPHPQMGGALPGGMVATDGKFIDGTIKPENMTWQVWAKNVTATSVAVLLVNAGDATQDVAVHLDGIVPCRPAGLCNESHLEHLCAPTCRTNGGGGSGAVRITARDLWARAALPDVRGGTFVAEGLAPHDSKFVLLTAVTGSGDAPQSTVPSARTNLAFRVPRG
uniref:alpha-galactosidase n=1 Tax=Haptolina ericina TaxID=156174 RepID=A0A7S3ANR3_9EUKA|mmetsp:Transcript_28036/g.63449  ORF Transcript_28036/g.63449 Transcript_28036/m.63449 type:complete len:217 (+) Transcript_28036:149-799(+)